MKYQIEDVFSPRSFPQNTYVIRKSKGNETIDGRMKKALAMKGNLIFVSGASKSGKTVLCHSVIDDDKYIGLSGSQITCRSDFWNHIAEQIPVFDTVTTTSINQINTSENKTSGIGVNIGVFSAKIGSNEGENNLSGGNVATTTARTERQIIQYLIANNKVLVIDDFHYISADAQMYIARTLKAELFNGLKAVIISLPHRSDEAIICNPDLIGRTTSIVIPPWTENELKEIAVKGFCLLDMAIDDKAVDLLARESITSPQLMQDNCFNLAFLVQNTSQAITTDLVCDAFRETVQNYSHYDRLVEAISEGPLRGIGHRKQYKLCRGTADIYQLLVCALKADPPVTTISMPELKERIRNLLYNRETLAGLVISSALSKIIHIAKTIMPDLDALEYKNQRLYILDPFLLFYLRWQITS